jgi:hypothetical protein
MFDHCPIVHTYSRAEAIADGVLIDVSPDAREAGITLPTAVTSAVWANYVKVPATATGQDERGRLWDVLWMLYVAIRRSPDSDAQLLYQLHVRNDDRLVGELPLVTLKAIVGPGDTAEPVLTIMMPDED